MAITFKRLKNGQFRITSKAQAKEALELVLELQEKITDLEQEHGIKDMRNDATELKRAATAYMDVHGVDVFTLEDGRIARLVRSFTGNWIGTKADARGMAGVRSLKEICGDRMVKLNSGKKIKLWLYISKRVPDPDAINEAVSTGKLREAEISEAYIEEARAPYVRFFDS